MHRTRLYEQVRNDANESLMQHLAMVKRVAVHLKVRLPPMMELAELVQIGVIGLLEASRTYDPTKGVDFEDFAYNRIRGAIIDEGALVQLLQQQNIAGAALDVFEQEPLKATEVFADCPNLVLTPHIAGVSLESNERVSELIARKVLEALK